MRLEEQSRRRRSIRESDLVHNNNNNKISDHVADFVQQKLEERKPARI
jgi:hypothetical protein